MTLMKSDNIVDIAVVMTCFNRKGKTLSCLNRLSDAVRYYNERHGEGISLSFYITDDGCTDGTSDAVRGLLGDESVHILQGDGNLYWAGGMRLAWTEALKEKGKWDFYLLLNDDTDVLPDCLEQLMLTHRYSLEKLGKEGIYSGITCSRGNRDEVTYGGYIYKLTLSGDIPLARPTGQPQEVFATNANILLVPTEVVEKTGIFHPGYKHGAADYDYTGMARRKGFPALVTPSVCGECDFDHPDIVGQAKHIMSLDKAAKRKYFGNPVHSPHDYLLYTLRNRPFRFPMRYVGCMLNVHFPRLYYWLHGIKC